MKMANIAQMVNVLQAVILTEGAKMVKTPTWYVFHMYQHHQDGELVESSVETKEVGLEEDAKVPNLTESVSMSRDGKLHMTITNLSLEENYEVESVFADSRVKAVKGEILTGDRSAHNTFEAPNEVHTEEFAAVSVDGDRIRFTVPACSVLHLEVTPE